MKKAENVVSVVTNIKQKVKSERGEKEPWWV